MMRGAFGAGPADNPVWETGRGGPGLYAVTAPRQHTISAAALCIPSQVRAEAGAPGAREMTDGDVCAAEGEMGFREAAVIHFPVSGLSPLRHRPIAEPPVCFPVSR